MSGQLAEALLRYTDNQPGESPFMTAIDGLAILRSDHPKPPRHMIALPAMCIVAQGAKWATFGDNRLEYRAGQALVVGVEQHSHVDASLGASDEVLFDRRVGEFVHRHVDAVMRRIDRGVEEPVAARRLRPLVRDR